MEMHFFSLQGKYHCADLQNDVILEVSKSKYMQKSTSPSW